MTVNASPAVQRASELDNCEEFSVELDAFRAKKTK
jgi:hypothetical protein